MLTSRSLLPPLIVALAVCCSGNRVLAQDADTEDTTDLEEVVVGGDGESEPQPDLPQGTSVSGETLRRTPGAADDPIRALQSLPGFTFTSDEQAAPAVRGSRPDDNLFLADFLPVGYLFHGGGIVSVFNADLVESFDIYASAYGPEFSGVTGGVFDVKLRDPATDRFRASIDVSVLQGGFLIEGPVSDDQSFYLAARRSYLDLVVEDQLEDEDDGVTIVEFPNYSDYQGKYVWQANDASTLRLQINGATDRVEVDIDESAEGVETDPIFAGRFSNASNFHSQALVWEQQGSNGRSLVSALAHRSGSSSTQVGGAGNIELDVDTLQWKNRLILPVSVAHDLSFGLDIARTEADIDLAFSNPGCTEFDPGCFFTGAEREEVSESLSVNGVHAYVKDSWYLNDRVTLFPGLSLQAEDFLDGYSVEPRFALEYAHSDDLILSASTGLYHQTPAYDQVNEVLGNPDLDYVRSVQTALGMEKRFAHGWSVKNEVYYKDLSNLVASDEETRYNNDGRGWAYGFETLVRKNLTSKFSGWLALSLSEARRKDGEEGEAFAFEYDQPVNATVVASYEPFERWRVAAKLWAHSGATYTPITGATEDPDNPGFYTPEFGDNNSERLPSFARLDLRVDHTINLPREHEIGLYLEVLNLLDRKNLSYYEYNADYSERREVTQLPRIVGIGFNFEY